MKDFNPSATAAMTAAIRAVHFKYFNGKLLYEDPYGEVFTNYFYRMLTAFPWIYRVARATYYRRLLTSEGWIVGRARFVQDEILNFVNSNPNHQIVILGAGYDSFALKKEISSRCNIIFEVDHPATMRRKRQIINKLKIENHIHFVSVNFENQKLFDRLVAAGFQTDIPTFFAWTGNLFYLTKPAVAGTFADISNQMTSTVRVAFDYMDPLVLGANASVTLIEMRKYVAAWTEPWINAYSGTELRNLLNQMDYQIYKELNEHDQTEIYFKNYPGLVATQGFRWMLIGKL